MHEPGSSIRPPRLPLPPRLVLFLLALTVTIRFALERDVDDALRGASLWEWP